MRVPPTWNVSDGWTAPEDNAAAAVIVLFTEPGSHVSVTARFTSVLGFAALKAFGSNVGYVAIA